MSKSYNLLAQELSEKLRTKGWMIASAESCTGGMISAAMTDLAGSSDVFDRGFVTYSNEAKMELLGVRAETLTEDGAVSPQVAEEMAVGAIKNSNAQIAISVTGIAGPGGGSDEKPVGLVYLGIATKEKIESHNRQFQGTRADIREQTVQEALTLLIQAL